MSKKYYLYQVDAFTTQPFRGNPAGVVLNAEGLTEPQMLEIARELNNSETAFVFSSPSPDYDVHVRFFTPAREVPICGHATVATHLVRTLEQNLTSGQVLQKTGAGILPVEILREKDDVRIIMTQGKLELGKPFDQILSQELCIALRLPSEQLRKEWPIQVASTGFGKVMVPIQSEEVLNRMEPDWEALCRLSEKIGCNGYYVFAPNTQNTGHIFRGRMFAPISGVREDPVTGNANGPLGGYLVHHKLAKPKDGFLRFSVLQGEAMGRAGTIGVEVRVEKGEPTEIKISGQAVIVFRTELEL